MSAAPSPEPERSRLSPALLLAIFPLLGVIAAVLLIISQPQAAAVAPTPAPVLPPPIQPTQDLFDTDARIDFALPLLGDDTPVRLSDYEGQVVFLNFWATWCVPCERELPAIESFMAEQDAVTVLAINIGETADVVQPWLEERGISGIPILMDTDFAVRDSYGIFQIPVTFALDTFGVVREQKYGEITLDDLRAYAAAVAENE
jgi:thiol-disulfide isomerase/thioredoxin